MEIRDSLQQKRVKITDKVITMYVCGPTVYSDVHIGNMRPVVIFDILQRLFMTTKQKFYYIQNITDIDDKIINQAFLEKISEEELATKYTNRYFTILKQLNIYFPNKFVKVSESIADIIKFVDLLIKNKAAYVKDGNVYFDTSNYQLQYGQLTNKKLNELQANTRIDNDVHKNNPHDFVLWKKTNIGKQWQSPWSLGRPGWHTECALFVYKYFKLPISIHGGGIDLNFPHHENERIQLLALQNIEPVKIWLHNGHLFNENLKMSKSLNNTILVKDFLKEYHPNVLRYLLITTHYTKPLNISKTLLEQAVLQIANIDQVLKSCLVYAFFNEEENSNKIINDSLNRIVIALEDDLNFNLAWLTILDLLKQANSIIRTEKMLIRPLLNTLCKSLYILGLEFILPKYTSEVKQLLVEWNDARTQKNYKLADTLRKLLQEQEIL